jgi:hypothetical protein
MQLHGLGRPKLALPGTRIHTQSRKPPNGQNDMLALSYQAHSTGTFTADDKNKCRIRDVVLTAPWQQKVQKKKSCLFCSMLVETCFDSSHHNR